MSRSRRRTSPRGRAPRRWLAGARLALEIALVAAALALTLLWASIPTTDALADENPTTTAFIELRRRAADEAHRPFRLSWRWRRLAQISPFLRSAVIHAEDARFYEHDGVDWRAIENAAESNLSRGTMSVGGSTITQQLAKNLYLSPSRSAVRKLRELLIAARLEDRLTKERILELYLNVAEWGDGVFGAEAAARRWFGRSAAALTATQAARLAAALPNPFVRTPQRRTAALQRKVARLLSMMRREGLLDEEAFRAAVAEAGLPAPPRSKSDAPVAIGADEGDGAPAEDGGAAPDATAPAPPPDEPPLDGDAPATGEEPGAPSPAKAPAASDAPGVDASE